MHPRASLRDGSASPGLVRPPSPRPLSAGGAAVQCGVGGRPAGRGPPRCRGARPLEVQAERRALVTNNNNNNNNDSNNSNNNNNAVEIIITMMIVLARGGRRDWALLGGSASEKERFGRNERTPLDFGQRGTTKPDMSFARLGSVL